MSKLNKRIQFIKPKKNGREPSNFPTDGVGIPMRITRLFPMKLKEVTVSSLESTRKETDLFCIQEMMNLFDCFEKNEYDRKACEQQAKILENCYTTNQALKQERKARRLKLIKEQRR